jgi:hypothetical protein
MSVRARSTEAIAREQAAECRNRASRSSVPDVKQSYLELAQEWICVAERMAKLAATQDSLSESPQTDREH